MTMTSVDYELKIEAKKAEISKLEEEIERLKDKNEKDKNYLNHLNEKKDTDDFYRGEFYAVSDRIDRNEYRVNTSIPKRLASLKKQIESAKKKFEKAKLSEELNEKLPEVLKKCEKDLRESWITADIARRDECVRYYNSLDNVRDRYDKFFEKYDQSDWELMNSTDLQIREDETKKAHDFILDLFIRIRSKVGEIKNVENLHWGGKDLNGIVEGTLGTVNVHSIVAGGYNVQRLHLRTLLG